MVSKARKLCCASAVLTLFLGFSAASCVAAENGFAAIAGSLKPTTDVDMGEFSSAQMTIEVALAPRNASALSALLTDLYNANSKNYQHWLGKGEFYSLFAPDSAQVAAVANYLGESGLDVEQTSSPFLLRASGPSSMIESTFQTSIHSYRNPRGITYYSNA